MKRFVRALRKNLECQLLQLNLSGNPLGDEGLSSLCDALKLEEPIMLKSLFLREAIVGDTGASRLAVALKSKPTNLTMLDLSGNRISGSGARQIAKMLKGGEGSQSPLKELVLCHNQLHGAGELSVNRIQS